MLTQDQQVYELERDVEFLTNALEAALRWPYDAEMKAHWHNPSNIPAHFDDRYKMDMYDIRAGLRVIERRRTRSSGQEGRDGK